MSWMDNWRLLLTFNLHSHTYTCPCIHTPYTLTQCEVVRRARPRGTDLKSQLHRRLRQELLVLRPVWARVSQARLGNLGCSISESKKRAGDIAQWLCFPSMPEALGSTPVPLKRCIYVLKKKWGRTNFQNRRSWWGERKMLMENWCSSWEEQLVKCLNWALLAYRIYPEIIQKLEKFAQRWTWNWGAVSFWTAGREESRESDMGLGPSMACVWPRRPHDSYMSLDWYCATEFETRVLAPAAWECHKAWRAYLQHALCSCHIHWESVHAPNSHVQLSELLWPLCQTLLQIFVLTATFWRGQSLLFSPKLLSPCSPFVVAHLLHCFCDCVFVWFLWLCLFH